MTTEVKPLQPKNALSSIVVIPSEIVIEVRPVHPSKAQLPIIVKLLGNIVFLHPITKELADVLIIALQSSRESNTGLRLSTLIVVNPEQFIKEVLLILVKLSGIVIEVKA
jgi:hypothetical protein